MTVINPSLNGGPELGETDPDAVGESEASSLPNGSRFQPGNQAAVQTGIYSVRKRAEVQARVAAFTGGIVSDLGGESELSTIERAYIDKLGDVEVTLRLLADDIASRGLLTPVGGVRRAYEQFLRGIDRWDRLAQRLGMKRRAK